MKANLKEHKSFLLDKNITKIQKDIVIQHINKKQLLFLIEIIYNILQGIVNIPAEKIEAVRKKKKLLRRIVDKKNSLLQLKRNILVKQRKILIKILESVNKSLKYLT